MEEARKVKQEISLPITSHFKDKVSKKLLRNYKVTVEDISRAELIYGSLTPILQGKTTRIKTKGSKIERIPLPLPISKHHKDLQLYIEFFCEWSPFSINKNKQGEFHHLQAMQFKEN